MILKNFFQAALDLARSVKGATSPNPAVGSLIVKNGKIIGKGATRQAGQDHAEVVALKEAGQQASGAEMFVTLEPCVAYKGKRTPACSDAIIRAGIRTIHIGTKDPNPHINGRGIETLRQAGLKVVVENSKEARELNEDFFKYIQTGLPFITAKYAMTLDGNIATLEGDSKWISNSESRKRVHEIRNQSDAILTGIGTVLQDNPRLNVRLSHKNTHNPLRVIVDPRGETPVESEVMQGSPSSLFIITEDAPADFHKRCIDNHKQILELPKGFSMQELIHILGKNYHITSLLIEGGSRVFYRAFHEGIIDKYIIFIAPRILGGQGLPPFNGKAPDSMKEAIDLKNVSYESINGDLLINGYAK